MMSFKVGMFDDWFEEGGLNWEGMGVRYIWMRSVRMNFCGNWEVWEKYLDDMVDKKKGEGEGEEKKV